MKPSTTTHKRRILGSIIALAFWLLVWQGLSLLVDKPWLLASPLETISRLLTLSGKKVFWQSVGATGLRVLGGFLSALLLGILLATLSSRFALVRMLLAPLLGVVRATPVASFIILALIWLPTNRLPAFIAFLMVLPLSYSNLSAGLEALDRQLLEMADLFRMPRWRRLRLIYLPGLMPYLTAICTAGLGFAWKSVIAAEVIAHPALSIGKQIYSAKIYLEIADLFAWTLGVILISVVLERSVIAGLRRLERRMQVGGKQDAS